jgi:hypothetical protein
MLGDGETPFLEYPGLNIDTSGQQYGVTVIDEIQPA